MTKFILLLKNYVTPLFQMFNFLGSKNIPYVFCSTSFVVFEDQDNTYIIFGALFTATIILIVVRTVFKFSKEIAKKQTQVLATKENKTTIINSTTALTIIENKPKNIMHNTAIRRRPEINPLLSGIPNSNTKLHSENIAFFAQTQTNIFPKFITSHFPKMYYDLLLQYQFFHLISSLAARFKSLGLDKGDLNKYFKLSLGNTFLRLFERGYNLEELSITYSLLFPHADNRTTLEWFFSKIEKMQKFGSMNIYKYLQEDLKNSMLEEFREVLQKVSGQNFVSVEEALSFCKLNKNFSLKFHLFPPNTIINELDNQFVNLAKQSKPDGYLEITSTVVDKVTIDVKNIRDIKNSENLFKNIIRIVFDKKKEEITLKNAIIQQFNQLQEIANSNKLRDDDLERFSYYTEKLNLLINKVSAENLDSVSEEFIKLYIDSFYWLKEYKLTINIPQIITINDFDLQKLDETIQEFIRDFCENFSESSILMKCLQTNAQPLANIANVTDSVRLLKRIYTMLFPNLFP